MTANLKWLSMGARCAALLVATGGVSRVLAAAAPGPEGPIVQLPPMLVAGSSNVRSWLYVQTADREYLSRCPAGFTRDFVEAQQRVQQTLRAFVPERFLLKTDVPAVTLIIGKDLKQAGDDLVAQELRRNFDPAARIMPSMAGNRRPPAEPQVQFLSDLRLDDRDMTALFAYLDQREFDGERLRTTPEAVRVLLERRTPMLSPWLVEGIVSIYRQSRFTSDAFIVPAFSWLSEEESGALAGNAERPRVLLPMNELFAPDALRDEDGNELRKQTWRAQGALFFRWALDPANQPARAAFWKLAERAGSERVTEEVFEACFGFGFSDMRDRLSDYLPQAMKASFRLAIGKLPPLPKVETRPATPGEVARLRGEWERIEIGYVKGTHPEFAARYADQARRTLRRAIDEGESDPRMRAVLGLCEVDAGNDAAARPWLESAIDAQVVRPRAYFEYARLRFAELTRDRPARELTAAELAPVVRPLRLASVQAPPLPEAFALLADAWLRCKEAPPDGDFALLAKGANLFSWQPALNYRIALLQVRHGHRAEAAVSVANGLACATDEPTRARFAQLQTMLSAQRKP